MPKSALPPHMQGDVDDVWAGTDNSSWLMRMKKRLQYIFAAGPRVPSGFFRWREIPKTLFCISGNGSIRVENSDGSSTDEYPTGLDINTTYLTEVTTPAYLSRIQPWCRWHISLQWPLFFSFAVYYKQKDVSKYPDYPGEELNISKLFVFQIGYKRDGDKVYWPTMFLGGRWE